MVLLNVLNFNELIMNNIYIYIYEKIVTLATDEIRKCNLLHDGERESVRRKFKL